MEIKVAFELCNFLSKFMRHFVLFLVFQNFTFTINCMLVLFYDGILYNYCMDSLDYSKKTVKILYLLKYTYMKVRCEMLKKKVHRIPEWAFLSFYFYVICYLIYTSYVSGTFKRVIYTFFSCRRNTAYYIATNITLTRLILMKLPFHDFVPKS